MRPDGELLCFQRPRNGGSIAAEISAELAASVALGLMLAFVSSLLPMDFARVAQVRTTPLNQMPAGKILFQTFFKILFDATDLISGHTFTVGKFGKPITVTRDTGKFFDMAVPRLEVFITYGPVDSKSIAIRSFKIKITPPLGVPGPEQGFSADLISTYPVKRFFLCIRMLLVLDKKMLGVLLEGIAAAHYGIVALDVLRHSSPMFKLPGHHVRSGIVGNVFDVTTPFKHQGFKAALG